jgi:DNA-binding CsgD family transcriptional regulator
VIRVKEFIPELDSRGFIKHAADLKKSLKGTHQIVRNSINRCDAEAREAYFKETGRKVLIEHTDTKLKEGIIEDLNIQINQLATGRDSGKRGVHRKNPYDAKSIDPMYIQKFFQPTNSRSHSTLSEHQLYQINEALSYLSAQERTCYVMIRGYCVNVNEAAGMLGVTVRSVRSYLKRADKKIKAALDENIFLQGVEWEYESESD